MSDHDDKPVTADVMRAYINVLEKQVSQMTLVVSTLEELNDKLEKIEGHFTNGFRSDIMEHTTKQITAVLDKIEKSLTTLYIVKDHVEDAADFDRSINDKVFALTNEIKDKINGLNANVNEFRSAIKIDRAINIVGWSAFIISIITVLLKAFGKL